VLPRFFVRCRRSSGRLLRQPARFGARDPIYDRRRHRGHLRAVVSKSEDSSSAKRNRLTPVRLDARARRRDHRLVACETSRRVDEAFGLYRLFLYRRLWHRDRVPRTAGWPSRQDEWLLLSPHRRFDRRLRRNRGLERRPLRLSREQRLASTPPWVDATAGSRTHVDCGVNQVAIGTGRGTVLGRPPNRECRHSALGEPALAGRQMTSRQVTAAKRLATLLAATPSLRAKFFTKPTKLGRQLPPRKYWDYGINPKLLPWHPWEFVRERHYKRARLAQQTLEEMAKRIDEGELSSSVNTDAIFEDFFLPIVRVSQRTFNAIFILSIAAFIVGSGLIGAGVYIALYPPKHGSSTILGSVFGGTGAVSALSGVYAMATKGIARASTSNAKLRTV